MGDFMAALLNYMGSINEPKNGPTPATISIWKEGHERESELVTKGMRLMVIGPRRTAQKMIARTYTLAEKIACGEVDAMNKGYDGFPVLEHEIGKIRKGKWFVYVAYVNSKTCLLLLIEGRQREEARRRALIWIEKCPDREAQGQPVFVDLLGRVLESASSPEADDQKDA